MVGKNRESFTEKKRDRRAQKQNVLETSATSYTFVGNPRNSSSFFPLDIDLDIEDSTGVIVATAWANGDNQVETLNWTCTSSGTYYLVVYEGMGRLATVPYYDIDTSTVTEVTDWELY